MHWLSPFIVPLIVAAILLRRALRPQKPKRVRLTLLWMFPALLLLVTISSVLTGPTPGILASIAWLIAMVLGGLMGWYRVHTLEFSVDSESGKVSARATQFGAFLIVGLIALRYGADTLIKQLGLGSGDSLVYTTDGMMLFSTSMFVARSVHTWIRARALVVAHRTATPLPDKTPTH
jgi:energy-converting hydrogenase Eha subunit A